MLLLNSKEGLKMLKTDYEGKYINELRKGFDKKIKNLSELKENLCLNNIDILNINALKKEVIPLYLKEYTHKSMLYIIKANFISKNYKEKISEAQKKNVFAMARINKNNFDYTASKNICLYVGSSHNIYKRLLEHLGFGAQKTFALHLEKWWDNLPIQIEIYEVCNNENDALQIIEDILWEQNKPLFGRQGKK